MAWAGRYLRDHPVPTLLPLDQVAQSPTQPWKSSKDGAPVYSPTVKLSRQNVFPTVQLTPQIKKSVVSQSSPGGCPVPKKGGRCKDNRIQQNQPATRTTFLQDGQVQHGLGTCSRGTLGTQHASLRKHLRGGTGQC